MDTGRSFLGVKQPGVLLKKITSMQRRGNSKLIGW
jgi:hypothetical protein